MDNDRKEEIYFLGDNFLEVIAEILDNNGITETLMDAAEKDDSAILAVFDLIKELAKEKISEKDFIDSLQKKLRVSADSSKNILQGVKEKILPQTEKILIGGSTQSEKPTTIISTKITSEDNKKEQTTAVKEKPKIKNITTPPRKSDTYREPI